MNTRIEKDTLGEMAVPAEAYYGAQTARAVQNFPDLGAEAASDLCLGNGDHQEVRRQGQYVHRQALRRNRRSHRGRCR